MLLAVDCGVPRSPTVDLAGVEASLTGEGLLVDAFDDTGVLTNGLFGEGARLGADVLMASLGVRGEAMAPRFGGSDGFNGRAVALTVLRLDDMTDAV